ncbi:MAG TPA: NAAT family transporter [Burkholderiales bacterium]|nr:NAAT family transporter [Burkholderiales bacterium]
MLEGLLPLSGYLRFFVTLVAVLDPFLAVPVFLALTGSRTPAQRAMLVRVVATTVFLVLAGSALFGERLLVLIGASLPAFRVGGGLVLLLMALAMLNARAGGVRQSQAEAEAVASGELSGVVPLAVPLLAGPGAISTTILAAQAGGMLHLAAILACIALVCALTWATLGLAAPIGARLGTTGLNIATRLLGLLLAALAIQTMAEGLRALFPGLA